MKTKSFISSLLVACTFAGSLLSTPALAWWNGDWSYRMPLKLDTSSTGAETKQAAENFPVLVRLHTGNFTFTDSNIDGSDIRFVAGDDKTPLKYQIEKFDPVNNLAFIWVMLPKLDANSQAQTLYMYYGNESAKAGDAQGMYDANQLAVFHFQDKDSFKDATAYGNHATAKGVTTQNGTVIGTGAGFNGSASLSIAATPANAFSAGGGFTFSAWVKSAASQEGVLFARQGGGIEIGLDTAGIYARVGGGATGEARSQTALKPGEWHHVVVTVSDKLVIYLDGKAETSLAVSLPALNGEMVIGAAADGSHGFKGEMDEVRIAKAAYPADWFAAEMGSEGANGKLLGYDASEATEEAGTSYFSTILHSVTTDGWVVIGILAVMFVIAVWVMFEKAVYVNRMDKSNSQFMDKFRELSTDLAMIDKAKELAGDFLHSSLYRIYHIGAVELAHRFKDTDSAHIDKTLSPQSLNAIRASLDAGLVKETHRLNRLMVLLTIAISGGPFLGLLGTVVGVMITFAAIAASGDVNVNAIAPGIAAALVATVAGLAVAIPALFGYNYLGSRVKTITSDMHIFVDEFITKLAENYSR